MSRIEYSEWLKEVAKVPQPWPWQVNLAQQTECRNQLIRIPTGMGKTLGVLAAWVFNRLVRKDQSWPRRLVWCLPMRTLVEQTESEAKRFLEASGFKDQVAVHKLLGGFEESRWYESPQQEAVLVGTQDMLLSRALNRGYAMGRAAWPRAFGLINNDALWVMDEVQLMGVGLTTSAQTQAFWERYAQKPHGIAVPRATWWMSATLQPEWLRSRETSLLLESMKSRLVSIPSNDRSGPTWEARKPLSMMVAEQNAWSEKIAELHTSHAADRDTGRQTLVIVNTVKTARLIYESLAKRYKKDNTTPELKLIHSRFRPYERSGWSEFLKRSALTPDTNRIIVATQVVEAGVDISASCLISELAPWTCLVQRFGRAARYGGVAEIIVLDSQPTDEKKSAPYQLDEVNSAREAIQLLLDRSLDASIRSLEEFEDILREQSPDVLARLYPHQPLHVLMHHEFEELFDTSPDLTGADLDVSRFIREGEDRDLQVFWRDFSGTPGPNLIPSAQELCSVPIGDAKSWIKKVATESGKVFAWDYLDGRWIVARGDSIRPGIILLVHSSAGGYEPLVGFTGERGASDLDISQALGLNQRLSEIQRTMADHTDDSEAPSEQSQWRTILTHAQEAQEEGKKLSDQLKLPEQFSPLLDLVYRLHDWGKAHPVFASGTYRVQPKRTDLAKAPGEAWLKGRQLYRTPTHGHRRGFRHELASCLAVLELLRQTHPTHSAIDTSEFAWFISAEEDNGQPTKSNTLADELSKFSATEINLLLFLIASHHGKVRLSIQSSPKDQDFDIENSQLIGTGMPIRGVRQGDELLVVKLPDQFGQPIEMPSVMLHVEVAAMGISNRYGRSWTERMMSLLSELGPFCLGYLESIVRSVDGCASQITTPDPELAGCNLQIGAEPSEDDESELADEENTLMDNSEKRVSNESEELEGVDV